MRTVRLHRDPTVGGVHVLALPPWLPPSAPGLYWHWQLPRWCPSTDPDPDDWSLCAACGRRTSAARGWNSSGLAAHAPAPAITDRYQPCPRHGWRDMRVPYGRVGPLRDVLVCGFFRCGFESFRRPAPRLS